MNAGVIEIKFEDVYFLWDGEYYGNEFEGIAHVDWNKNVVAIDLESTHPGRPCGKILVPPMWDALNLACNLADQIEDKYDDTIEEKLNELAVEIGEAQIERSDREEHSTLRAVRGRVA